MPNEKLDLNRSGNLEEFISRFSEVYSDFIDFNGVISSLNNPQELGYTYELVNNSTVILDPLINGLSGFNRVYADDYKDFLKYAYGVRLRRVAYKILPTNLVGTDILVDLTRGWPSTTFSYQNFMEIYTLLENLYDKTVNHKMGCEDLLNIYFGGLDERLLYFLDEFNMLKDEDIPEPSKEFFKAMKHVKYQDNILKNIFFDFEKIIGAFLTNMFGKCDNFLHIEKNVLQTLIFSSAVTDGRNEIVAEDIIKAYNAYFKLLKTDVTQYTLRENVFESTNYNSLKSRFVQFSLRIGILYG